MGRDFQRQKALNPERCHRRMVSGFTTWDKSSRLGQIRVIHTCPFRKSYPDVLMMQSGQDWNGDNDTGPLDGSMQGRIFL